MASKKNAFYAQSGGVTAVINASACGVIETARLNKDRIGKVYAGRNGIIGALTEDLIDTSKESATAIAALRYTPSGAFGSCRYKLKSLEANRREYLRMARRQRRDRLAAKRRAFLELVVQIVGGIGDQGDRVFIAGFRIAGPADDAMAGQHDAAQAGIGGDIIADLDAQLEPRPFPGKPATSVLKA